MSVNSLALVKALTIKVSQLEKTLYGLTIVC